MSRLIDVHTPDGERHRHVDSFQNGRVEARTLADGTIEVIGVHETKEIRSFGGGVTRAASRTEQVLGTYPADSRIEYLGS